MLAESCLVRLMRRNPYISRNFFREIPVGRPKSPVSPTVLALRAARRKKQPSKFQHTVFRRNLKRLMLERGVPAAHLHELIEADPKTVKGWLGDRGTAPQCDKLHALGQIFGVSLSWLISDEGPQYLNQVKDTVELRKDLEAEVGRRLAQRKPGRALAQDLPPLSIEDHYELDGERMIAKLVSLALEDHSVWEPRARLREAYRLAMEILRFNDGSMAAEVRESLARRSLTATILAAGDFETWSSDDAFLHCHSSSRR